MPQVLVLTRQDGTTEIAHIGSPYLAVQFELTFHREPSTATDAGWLAFTDRNDRPPSDDAELLAWLKPFVGIDTEEYRPPDPMAVATNGSTEHDSSQG
jgi:hypothetical protein